MKQAHIQLDNDINVTKAIIVGDPARVDKIGVFMDNVEEIAYNREYKSLKGSYCGEEILIISTGIGAPSAAICIEELANIGIKTLIRVGSCGAMQTGIALGELIIATAAVRDDGLTTKYVPLNYPAVPSIELLQLAQEFAPKSYFGLVRSHDGFYMDDNDQVQNYWSKYGVIGSDMETGATFVIGTLRGMRTLSILNNVVCYEEDLMAGVNDLVAGDDVVAEGEKASIILALEILAKG